MIENIVREYNIQYTPEEYEKTFYVDEDSIDEDDYRNTIIHIFNVRLSSDVFIDNFFKLKGLNYKERHHYLLYVKDEVEQDYNKLVVARDDLEYELGNLRDEFNEIKSDFDAARYDLEDLIDRLNEITDNNFRFKDLITSRYTDVDISDIDFDDEEVSDILNKMNDLKTDYFDFEDKKDEIGPNIENMEDDLLTVNKWISELDQYTYYLD